MKRFFSISVVPVILFLFAGFLMMISILMPSDVMLREALSNGSMEKGDVTFSTEMRMDNLDNFYFTLNYIKEKGDIPRLSIIIKDDTDQPLANLIASIEGEGIYFQFNEKGPTYRYPYESLQSFVEGQEVLTESSDLDEIDLKYLQESLFNILELHKLDQNYVVTEVERGHKSFNVWLRKSRYEIRSPLGSYELDLLDHPFMRIYYVDFQLNIGDQKLLFHTSFEEDIQIPKLYTDEEQIVDITTVEELMFLMTEGFNSNLGSIME